MENRNSKMNEKIQKKDISKNNRNGKKIFIFLLFGIVLIYFIYVIFLLIKQPTDIFTIEEGKLYQEETDIGYIIRDEVVIKGNNYKNGMEHIKNEGEKVTKDGNVFRYYSKNEESLKKQIEELDKEIQVAMKNQKDLYSSDVKIIENQLDEEIEKLNTLSDLSKITEHEKRINNLVTKKAKIVGEKSASGSHLKQLNDKRINLEKELNEGAETIKAPKSGIVSYKVDGLEEMLTPNNFSAISKEYLENLNLKTGNLIATNSECGKIINNFEAYIATISNSKNAKEAKVGERVKIRLSNNKEINAEIVYISQENEDENLLVIKIDKEIEELLNYRKLSFDLIWWSYSGLKVPNQAIVEKEGLNYVVRNRAGYLSEVLVKVKKHNEKYSIITNYTNEELKEMGFTSKEILGMKNIDIYDEIVLKPNLEKVK